MHDELTNGRQTMYRRRSDLRVLEGHESWTGAAHLCAVVAPEEPHR